MNPDTPRGWTAVPPAAPSAAPSAVPPAVPTEQQGDAVRVRKARSRVIAKNVYRAVLVLWALSGAAMILIWWQTTPNGYFWPTWPVLGMAIAASLWGLALHPRGPFRVGARKLERELELMRRVGE